jgi:hypothetical protein
MDGCITEMPKLLIWLENTYKQKKKQEWKGEGRSIREYILHILENVREYTLENIFQGY